MVQEPAGSDFARALYALYEAARGGRRSTFTQGNVVDALKKRHFVVSDRSISDWRHGRSVPSDRHQPTLWALVKYLEDEAARVSPDYRPNSKRHWRSLLAAADHGRKSRQGGSGPQSHADSGGRFYGDEAEVRQHFLPRDFSDRLDVLNTLSAFTTDRDAQAPSYTFVQAGPWAGKSALLAWFVLPYRPAGVDVVPYFIARRLGTDHPDTFRTTMCRQLATLVGKRAPSGLESLYEAAARASSSLGRTLLLVVDGLDEAAAPQDGGLSIAAMLPKALPPGMRVVVAGREHPPLPADVPEDHPLRDPAVVRRLTVSPVASVIRDMVMRDLQTLLKDREVGRPLLALLAAARGALSGEDLARLMGSTTLPYDVVELLGSVAGRSMRPDVTDHLAPSGPVWGDDPALRTYVLAHDELRRVASQNFGTDGLAEYEGRLHRWADRYRERGWPDDTPNYLLTGYSRLARESGEPGRLAGLVFDPRRQRRQVAGLGLDLALADIELAAGTATDDTPESLNVLAAAALSRTLLLRQARSLPRDIPRALAYLGDVRRARTLALELPHPGAKARALADVACALAGIEGDDQARKAAQETARESLRWAVAARRQTSAWGVGGDEAEAAVARAAAALMGTGQEEAGADVLRRTRGLSAERYEAWTDAATLLSSNQPALASQLLDELEEEVEALAELAEPADAADRATPVQLWAALALAAPDRADHLHDRILEHARAVWAGSRPLAYLDVLSLAASALAAARPDDARALVALAAERVEWACRQTTSLSAPDRAHAELGFGLTLVRFVRAQMDTGTPAERVRELLEGVPEDLRGTCTDRGQDQDPDRDGVDFADSIIARANTAYDTGGIGDSDDSDNDEAGESGRLAREAVAFAEQGREQEARHCLDQALSLLSETGVGAEASLPWLSALAGALVRDGATADADTLVAALSGPGERVRAVAAMSMAHADSGRAAEARRLAQEAAYEAARIAAEATDDPTWAFAAQALAHAGEGDMALDLIEGTKPKQPARRGLWRLGAVKARVAVAEGLAAHDPAAAGKIVDDVREGLEATRDLPRRLAALLGELGALLTASARADGPCRERLSSAVNGARDYTREDQQEWLPRTVLVDAVLRAGEGRDVDVQLEWLARAGSIGHEEQFPTAGVAVLHALLGDTEAAWRTVARTADPERRATGFASVAGHLARVPVQLAPTAHGGGPDPFTLVLRALALAASKDAPDDGPQAGRFLREALKSPDWYSVLPVLARMAAAAVPQLRDITFASLGLEPASRTPARGAGP
ncbi:hypothetical protein [Streptomyces sp. NPDC051567]|uniref:hypothetical protein n=1 Tax=Streptomyces sp. NPDC051567 TaxID=3365660 RepID=UPI0037A81AA1